ncbi:MAG: pitrilysin family protein [Holophagaceae bacterium]
MNRGIPTLASALALALAAAIPASAQAIPDRPEKLAFKPIQYAVPKAKDFRVKLKNGITAYVVPDPNGQPLVNIELGIHAGRWLDEAGKEGAAQLLGTLLRTGGTEKTKADDLDEKLDMLAAQAGSFMGDSRGSLSVNLLAKDAREGVGLLLEMLTQPAFQQDKLDLAKKNLRQQMERRNDDSTGIEARELDYLVKGEGHPSNRLPTAASLDAITREDLKALHARILTPANLMVSVAGRFDRAEMIKLLNETVGALKAGPAAKAAGRPPQTPFVAKPGLYVVDKDVNQGRVTLNLSMQGLRVTDADYPAVAVMNHVLGGGGFTSRFVKKIRSDEGLAYSAGTRATPAQFQGDAGHFSALFQTKTRTVAYGIRLALAELEKMRKDGITEEELKVAKGSIIEGFPARFPTKAALAGAFATNDWTGIPDSYLETYQTRIQAVTREDVLRVAKKYLDVEHMAILCVGNAKDMEAGDVKDHPGTLADVAKLPLVKLPLRDPLTLKPMK